MFKITTDSTTDLPKEYLQEHQVDCMPISYILDGVTYGRDKELDWKEFYRLMREEGKMPTTSQINPAEAKEYFLGHSKEFASKASATAKHVLVDNEGKANQIKEEIESGAKSFEDAAKEYSTCPSAQKGGSLGTFGRGQMVKEFENAVFDGELNKVIGPVKTQFGYHLIWVDDKNEGEVPEYDSIAEQVKGYLVNKKQQETYQSKLKELREKYCK